jgi:hypothetical protein
VFPGIFVSGNSRARGVHPLVAIGVIEMPMGVEQMFDWIGTKTAKRVSNFAARAEVPRINDELAVASRKHGNVSTRAD